MTKELEPPPGRFDDDHDAAPPTNVRTLTPKVRPSLADPLAGLRILPSIVMRGKENILAEAKKRIDYTWHEIVVAGTINLIGGPPSEGKTTLLFLIIACRLGNEERPFLGRNMTPAPKDKFIVLIEAEHSDGGTARKLIDSFDLMGISYDGLDRLLVIARKAVRIGDRAWSEIAYLVSLGLVSDIAVDTLARASSAEANDEAAQAALFDTIAQTIERAPVAADHPNVWLLAHLKKNDRTGGLGDIAGSNQRTGQSDTVIMVEGTKVDGETISSKVSFQKLRETPDSYPKPVNFSIVRGPDGKRRLTCDALTSDDDMAGKALEDIIWDLLTEPRTKRDIAERTRRNPADCQKAIDTLFAAGRLVGADVTYPGSKRVYKGIARRLEKVSGLSSGRALHRDASGRQWDDVADSDGTIGND